MAEKRIDLKPRDIFLHLHWEFPKEKKIKDFLARLSPENLPSLEKISQINKKLYALSIRAEEALLLLNVGTKTIHLMTPEVTETTLEKSNSSLNDVFALLNRSAEINETLVSGLIRIELRTDIQAREITSKFLPKSQIQKISSEIGKRLSTKGVRFIVGEKTNVIFDTGKKGKLIVIATEGYKEDPKDLLKRKVEQIQASVESLIMKLVGV